MPAANAKRSELETKELVLTRVIDAPRELVWKAWTDPKHLAQWWGPHGFGNPMVDIDVRPGGVMNIDMRGPDGTIYPNRGIFKEVVRPERLAFTGGMTGVFEVLTTVTFTERGGKTTINLHAQVTSAEGDAKPYLDGMQAGWTQSLERLEEVATPFADREIFATRLFDAPRELVFSTWTDPKHIANWWGPTGFRNTIQEMDVRPGGVWRFIMHGPDGRDYPNKIVYREIVRPERIVYDHESGPPFHVTVTFSEAGPWTKVSMHMLFASEKVRDTTVKEFGAIEGLHQTLGRLAKELQTMSDKNEKPFVISRTFDAPRDLMWKAWTDEKRMAEWFGPKGAAIFHSKNDLRPGGVYHYGMRIPDGSEIWGKWVYRDIRKPEKLEFIVSFSDPKGGITRHPMAPEWPLEMLSKITFVESNGRTTVTVEWSPYNAGESERNAFNAGRESMKGGWTGTMDQLETYLAGSKR
jgi:uncharacterized protein YndB with AHSA1/START domain